MNFKQISNEYQPAYTWLWNTTATKEKIEETYGTLTGYPVDYGIFAADDDSNGPLFFVKVTHQLLPLLQNTQLHF